MPKRIPSPLDDLDRSLGLTVDPLLRELRPAREARKRLISFVSGDDPAIYRYAECRDRLDLGSATSLISPALHFGLLAPEEAIWAAKKATDSAPDCSSRNGAETWLSEIIWREFFFSISYHFPFTQSGAFRSKMNNLAWINSSEDFAAWGKGQTGYPVVDAPMRQLAEVGWMSNRSRMITASFLVKNLLVDWRKGEDWFRQHLLDADTAINNGNWQWVAGTGTDAAPWFRIFNPILQGRRFDPAGTHIREWIPELREVPQRFIYSPWEMPPEVQTESHCQIGKVYPHPVVDYAESRNRALETWKQVR
jgi:deoxyribodipyrimidine photo-lyase